MPKRAARASRIGLHPASKSITAPSVSAFEVDRHRFICLLEQLRERVAHPPHDSTVGDIWPVAREIDECDVAVKLGYLRPPFTSLERQQPGHVYVHALILDDPHGDSGEVWLSAPIEVVTPKGPARFDATMAASKRGARARMLQCLDRWLMSVRGLSEPKLYPCLPPLMPKGTDHTLARDPLWFRLHEMVSRLNVRGQRQYAHNNLVEQRTWATRIERLMGESGLGEGILLRDEIRRGGKLGDWLIHSPLSPSPTRVPRPKEGRLSSKARTLLRSALAAWRDRREEQLISPDLAPTERAASPTGNGGRPRVASLKSDAALRAAWLKAKPKMTMSAFERDSGIEKGCVRRAIDRLRAETRRRAAPSTPVKRRG